jgi:hypothetical protein
MTATNTSTHYSTDETAPICGRKSKNVTHYLGEVSCLRCALVLRGVGLEIPVKKKVKRKER